MCGLAGVARVSGEYLGPEADELLRRMTRAVAHRGPDDTAYLRSDAVGLGFVRLSLVDPEGGGQPLATEDGSVVLIANGEIYNHVELAAGLPSQIRMRTRSDCEVLLHLYQRDGMAFLDKVRGMFALVLWDRANNRLILARDRFGIKPLFYHQNAERVVFGSEIKALFEDRDCPRELDWERALVDQLMHSAPVFDVSAAHAWFQGIELVPAASIVSIDLDGGNSRTHRYWEFPLFDGTSTGSETDLVRSYRDTLASAVAESGMADVEIGLFLSGGIDSAAVAALAMEKPRTFTALNGSTLANGDAEFGHRLARQLDLDNHQVVFDTAQTPGVEEWKRFVWLMETPLAGPEAYYKYELYRYVGAYAPEIKAMLLGAGSDEFNGGYSRTIAGEGDWDDFVANLTEMGLRRDRAQHPGLGVWWEQSDPPLLNAELLREPADHADPYSTYFRWKYRDIQLYNCWHEDRTAAGNGIEARVPFLDHRLVELVAAIPEPLRADLVWDKQILRRALRGVLPPDVLSRPKTAFFYGDGVRHTYRTFARMLAQDNARLLEEAFYAPGAKQFLNMGGMRATVQHLVENPTAGHIEFLLRVVNLGLLAQMTVDRPAPPVAAERAPVSRALSITDWDLDRTAIEQQVLRCALPGEAAILALREDVMLLPNPEQPTTWYVLLSGTIEYEVDAEETPEWLRLLRAMDGARELQELLEEAACTLDDVASLLAESIDLGVVQVLPHLGKHGIDETVPTGEKP